MAETLQTWRRRARISRLVFAALIVLYAVGAFVRIDYVHAATGVNVGLRAGGLHVGWQNGLIPLEANGFSLSGATGQIRWLPRFLSGTHVGTPLVNWWILDVPWWPVVVLAGAVALRAQRHVVRIRRCGCHRCGYPRAGIAPDAPCPECGLEGGKS